MPKTKRAQGGSASEVGIAAAIAGLAVLMFGTLFSLALWGGARRGAVLGTASGTDTDKDGKLDTTDPDDDNDGLVDPDDPLPLSHGPKRGDIDLDNDGLSNSKDLDDDGDLKADTADYKLHPQTGLKLDLSLDYNNNLKLDHKERHANRKHDLDRDGIPDVREWIEVCRAAAQERGIAFPDGVQSLAEVPAEILASLPTNWHFGVVHDRNNNGVVDGLPQAGAGRPRDYANYLAGGTWEETYLKYAADPKVKDVIRCLACEGTERIGLGGGGGSLPFFSKPAWSRPEKPGLFSRVFKGEHSPYKKYHEYYGGKHSADYGPTKPQFVGGEYVTVTATEGGAGAEQGTAQTHDGSWYSHVFTGGGTGGTGGDAGSGGTGGSEPYSGGGGGGGHMTMGGGGGGGYGGH